MVCLCCFYQGVIIICKKREREDKFFLSLGVRLRSSFVVCLRREKRERGGGGGTHTKYFISFFLYMVLAASWLVATLFCLSYSCFYFSLWSLALYSLTLLFFASLYWYNKLIFLLGSNLVKRIHCSLQLSLFFPVYL